LRLERIVQITDGDGCYFNARFDFIGCSTVGFNDRVWRNEFCLQPYPRIEQRLAEMRRPRCCAS